MNWDAHQKLMDRAGEEAARAKTAADNTKFDIDEIDEELQETAKEVAKLKTKRMKLLEKYQTQMIESQKKNAVYAALYNQLPKELRHGWAKP